MQKMRLEAYASYDVRAVCYNWLGSSGCRICLEPVQICRIDALLHHPMTGQAEKHHSALSEFSDVQFSGCLSSAP